MDLVLGRSCGNQSAGLFQNIKKKKTKKPLEGKIGMQILFALVSNPCIWRAMDWAWKAWISYWVPTGRANVPVICLLGVPVLSVAFYVLNWLYYILSYLVKQQQSINILIPTRTNILQLYSLLCSLLKFYCFN